ncbi:CdaR family protein [Geobacter sp.]|uniref:CdaR family protein n=1 Tax=Geobacter sp. TaxID=46610 RepID=UPI0026280806|nr:CdaR family protein [Geobacter sp.]
MKWTTVTRDAGIKILSLVLAAALWLSVAGNRTGELTLTVPLAVRNLPPGVAVTRMEHSALQVTISGPKILLLKLRGEKIIMPLDMRGLREGRALFAGFDRSLPLPTGVRVTRVCPASVEVVLARGPVVKNP